MTSPTKLGVLHLLLAASLITAGACGDDDDDDTGGSGGSGTEAGSGGKGGAGGNKAGSGGSGGTSGTKAGSGGAGGKGGTGGTKAGSGGSGGTSGTSGGDGEDAGPATSAADLRVTLNLLLSEHLTLAAKSTAAYLGKRTPEYDAYADLLGKNGDAISDLVGAVSDSTTRNKFSDIWKAHNGYFVAYTKAVADKDDGAKTTAVNDLTTKYVPDFSKLLAPLTGLEEQDIEALTKVHVTTTAAIVEAQATALGSKSKDDWTKAYTAYRAGFAHMKEIGNALSEAIAGKLPDTFKGDPKSKPADLRVGLNIALQEHLYLATFATSAALGDRGPESEAAIAALGNNGTDIGSVIKSLYDAAAEKQFNDIWSAHNGYFVAYTTGVAKKDDAAKAAAVSDLTTKYIPDFANFLHGATGDLLPVETLKTLIGAHVNMTKAVVDFQGDNKPADAAKADLEGAQAMEDIGDPLAAAIATTKNL